MRRAMLVLALLGGVGCDNEGLGGNTDQTGARDARGGADGAVIKPDLAEPGEDDMTAEPEDMAGASSDLSSGGGDLGGVWCGSMSCGAGSVCCVVAAMGGLACMASCPDGGVPITCDGPEDCGGNPCCATITNLTQASVTCSAKASDCAPSLAIQTRSGTARFCHTSADCTSGLGSSTLPDCCTGMLNGQSAQFCFSKTFASFLGLTCQ